MAHLSCKAGAHATMRAEHMPYAAHSICTVLYKNLHITGVIGVHLHVATSVTTETVSIVKAEALTFYSPGAIVLDPLSFRGSVARVACSNPTPDPQKTPQHTYESLSGASTAA